MSALNGVTGKRRADIQREYRERRWREREDDKALVTAARDFLLFLRGMGDSHYEFEVDNLPSEPRLAFEDLIFQLGIMRENQRRLEMECTADDPFGCGNVTAAAQPAKPQRTRKPTTK